jgi:hypothetical protein
MSSNPKTEWSCAVEASIIANWDSGTCSFDCTILDNFTASGKDRNVRIDNPGNPANNIKTGMST